MTHTSADTRRNWQRWRRLRRPLAVGLVAVLVIFAGCSGILGNGGDTASTPSATTGASGADSGTTSGGATPTHSGAANGESANTGGSQSGGGGGANTDTGQNGGAGAVSTEDNGSATGPTEIRLAHMSPDAPPLDLYLDDQRVLTNVSVGEISEYTNIKPGTHLVRIADADNPDSVAFNHTYPFPHGAHTIKMVGEWTVGNANDPAHIAPYILPDNDTPAGPHTAKVRMVATSPDAPAIDVTTANGTLLFDDLSLAESTDYIDLSPGTYHLRIRKASGNNHGDVLSRSTIKVSGGGVYTAFMAGYLTPKGEPANMSFRLIGSTDNQPENT